MLQKLSLLHYISLLNIEGPSRR